jgi:hypothetical protein
MTQTNQQGAALAVPTSSAIVAMHSRYEAAAIEQEAIDQGPTDGRARIRIDSAISDLVSEKDALRTAILRQVPDSRDEFAIVLFHANNSFDLIADTEGEDWQKPEAAALRIAMQHLFDFAASEFVSDPMAIGRAFTAEATRTHRLRRLRTGNVEA